MKKVILVASLISVLALTGCSNAPQLHKPSMYNYGTKVSNEVFTSRRNLTVEPILPYFYRTNGYLQNYDNFKIECVESYYSKDNKKAYGYKQQTSSVLVDNVNQRLRYNSELKSITNVSSEGAQLLVDELKQEKNDYYCEKVSNKVYCADVGFKILRVDTRMSGELFVVAMNYSQTGSNLASYASALYQDSSYSSGSYYGDETMINDFYVNGSVFTVSTRYVSEGEELKSVVQYKYTETALYLKVKATRQQISGNYRYNYEYYIDFSIKKTNSTVKNVDYTSYTLEEEQSAILPTTTIL